MSLLLSDELCSKVVERHFGFVLVLDEQTRLRVLNAKTVLNAWQHTITHNIPTHLQINIDLAQHIANLVATACSDPVILRRVIYCILCDNNFMQDTNRYDMCETMQYEDYVRFTYKLDGTAAIGFEILDDGQVHIHMSVNKETDDWTIETTFVYNNWNAQQRPAENVVFDMLRVIFNPDGGAAGEITGTYDEYQSDYDENHRETIAAMVLQSSLMAARCEYSLRG